MTRRGKDVAETERVRSIQDKTAPRYDRQMSFFDRVPFADGRQWACSQARGEVLEIAVGTGRNLAHYPAGARLTGIELSDEMLAIARRRATDLGIDADLRRGDAQALEFADGCLRRSYVNPVRLKLVRRGKALRWS